MIVQHYEDRADLMYEISDYVNKISQSYYEIRKTWNGRKWYMFKSPDDIRKTIMELLDDCITTVHEKLNNGETEIDTYCESAGVRVCLSYNKPDDEPPYGQFRVLCEVVE